MQVILCALAPYASLREKQLPAGGWVGYTKQGGKRFFLKKLWPKKAQSLFLHPRLQNRVPD